MTLTKRIAPPLPVSKGAAETVTYPCLTSEQVMKIIATNFKDVPIAIEKFGQGPCNIIFLPEATAEFDAMVGWGRKTPFNVLEQVYQGMGPVFVDKSGKVTLVIAHFLYIYAAERTPVSACIYKGSYDSIMERIKMEREIFSKNELLYNTSPRGFLYNPLYKYGKSIANLYGHTHPDIGVFFSRDDHTSGFASSTLPAATFVADPIRKEMKAMVGINEENAQILVLRYSSPREGKTKQNDVSDRGKDSMSVGDAFASILRCCNVINTSEEKASCKVSERKGFGGTLRIKASVKWNPGKKAKHVRGNDKKGAGKCNESVKGFLSQPAN